MVKKKNVKSRVIAILVSLAMIMTLLPADFESNLIFAATDDYQVAEINGINFYLYGATSVENAEVSEDSNYYVITYAGGEETICGVYVKGIEIPDIEHTDVSCQNRQIQLRKNWVEAQEGWIAVKCSESSDIPTDEPKEELPEITGISIRAYTGKYDGEKHDAVTVSYNNLEDAEVFYSTNDGESWDKEIPTIEIPGNVNVKVKINAKGYKEYISDTYTATVDKGIIEADVKAYEGTYNPDNPIAYPAVTVDVPDKFDIEYREDNDDAWKKEVPTIETPGSKKVAVKITHEYYEEYITSVTAKMEPATIEGVTVIPYTGIYDGESHTVIKEIQGINKEKDKIFYSTTSETEGFSEITPEKEPTITDVGEITFWVRVKREYHNDYITIPAMVARVDKAEIEGITAKGYQGVYDGDEHDAISVSGIEPEDTITYSTNQKDWQDVLKVKDAGSYTYYVKVERNRNYNEKIIPVNISIGKSDQIISFEKDTEEFPSEITYKENNTVCCSIKNKSANDSVGTITYKLDKTVADAAEAEIDSKTGKVTYYSVGKVKVIATIEEDDNYNQATAEIEFTIVYAKNPGFTMSEPQYYDDYNKCKWYSEECTISPASEEWEIIEGRNALGQENWKESITVREKGKYPDYKVAFKNKSGEITDLVSVDSFAIDKTKPSVTQILFEDVDTIPPLINRLTFGLFSNSAVKITVNATDEDISETDENISSNIQEIKLYKYTTANKKLCEVEFVESDFLDKSEGTAAFIIEPYFEGTIRAEIVDNVGNSSGVILATTENSNVGNQQGYIMLETNPPEVSEIVDSPLTTNVRFANINGRKVYSGDIQFDFSAKDLNTEEVVDEQSNLISHGSGLNNTIVIINDNYNPPRLEINYSEGIDNDLHKYAVDTKGVLADKDGAYKIVAKATDNAGNVTQRENTVYIDRTSPIITGFDFSLDKNVDVNDESGIYNAVEVTDYGFYFKEDVTVTILADDLKANNEMASGVDTITYKAVDVNGKVIYSGAKPVTNNQISFAIEKSFKGQIYAYATDKVQNMTTNSLLPTDYNDSNLVTEGAYKGYVHPNGSVVENKEKHMDTSSITFAVPKASGSQNSAYSYHYKGSGTKDKKMDYNTLGKVPLYKKDVKFGVRINDSYSGIREVTWTLMEGKKQTVKSISVDNNGKMSGDVEGWKLTKENNSNLVVTLENTDILVSGNYNNMILLVELTDRAGNKSYDYYVFGIDKTLPTVDVTYSNNKGDSISRDGNAYFKADRTATITVTERNFDKKDVKVKVTKNKKKFSVQLKWKTIKGSENKDDTKHIAVINYDKDADYTFTISYTDRADNHCKKINYASSVAPRKFTIDKTKPIIQVSYDNNAAQNSKYFNAGRTATIVIREHNFTEARITYERAASRDGKEIANPEISGWSKNGDVYTATVRYETDGDYKFDVKVSDKAGNKDAGTNYGTSVAAKDFTVDKTINKPVITGVENGKSYKKEVIPVITFDDINFASREIKLLRTRKNEKNVDVTDQYIRQVGMNSHGGVITNDTFKKNQDNDGIYTLSLKMTDKAGNESNEKVTFTVNRFGSVYAFNDYLISLQDSYVQAVDSKIVITEYNPDKLVKNSLKIQITHDGTPIKDVKYDVNPLVNNKVKVGNSGWYQYEYVIDTTNFSQDGIYKLTVSSEDEVGNKPETTNYDDCNVEFRVDTTPAEITNVSGLEKAIVNAESLNVKFDVFDAIGLKKIAVYNDDNVIAEFTEFEDLVNYSGAFKLSEGAGQNIKLIVEDLAGNITDTSSDNFAPEYKFNDKVTISTNIFVRWFANTLLFWSSIAVVLIVIGGILFFILLKKRKREEKRDK